MPNKRHIFFHMMCFVVCGIAISCMKEAALPVVIDFEYSNTSEFNTTPMTITLENHTTGADYFEWTFEGGKPAQSSDKNPGKVTFTTPGEHRITLRAWNHDLDDPDLPGIATDVIAFTLPAGFIPDAVT